MLQSRFGRRARQGWMLACAFTAALLLAGCDNTPKFQNLDITGNTQFGSDFSLPDTTGKVRTLGDFKGKAVVMFFGYTHCPDVCPTTMAELSDALKLAGATAVTGMLPES
ncbi:MAG: SCO family protein, partial [Burkholderia sp.]|uniref:SCO family protein n=1 Tax=Burkholderia sp. TaxID=36773 RepID=UPI002585FAC3